MNSRAWNALVLLILGSLFSGSAAFGDEPKPKPAESPQGEDSVAVRYARIKAEYDAQMNQFFQATEKIEDPAEYNRLFTKFYPDDVVFSRRMVELATPNPADPGSRDALLWVIDHPGRLDEGPYGDEFSRAAGLLVRHHGDDPEAVRFTLTMDNAISPHRDALLYGFLAAAKGRESMGMARLALAKTLVMKARFAESSKDVKARRKYKVPGPVGPDGKPTEVEREASIEDYANILSLRQYDPERLRADAERLFEEVASEYADIPYIPSRIRYLETVMKQPTPSMNGRPLTESERRQITDVLARKRTLGQVAEGHLDEMHNLAVGKLAPEINGVGFDGQPLKLSDYRGKVVALVFWGTWCGPCMGEVPRERELVERLKGKPFAMLGINCDEDKSTASKVMATERITWPNWHDGAPDTGPITRLYHVRAYPTVIILDDKGIIRHKGLRGESIDRAVEDLLSKSSTEKP